MELASNTVGSPGERHPENGVIESGGVNTMGEVLDGEWFVNRHATRRLTPAQLRAGSGMDHAPLQDGAWRILAVKPYGVRPGILMADGRDQLYILIVDPPDHREMSTGAHMVSSRMLHAIGYYVPETYLVSFEREKLVVAEGAEIESSAGNTRALIEQDVDEFLRSVARTASGRYRASAIYVSPPEWGGFLGPTQVYTTRSDDPNDIVPHEHRRDLRGLSVVGAWINFSTMRAVSTTDVLVDVDGIPRIRHFLVDLWATLGSGYDEVKRAQEGNDPFFDPSASLKNIVGFGFWSPSWMRAVYPDIPAVGRFESTVFDPEKWTTTEGLAPFENRLPDDEFWAAKQVMAFTDADIATVVSTGEYNDSEAATWITRTLIERRDKIGHTYLNQLLPLDNFRVQNGRLEYDDLAERYGVSDGPRTYTARWLRLTNDTGMLTRIEIPRSFDLPRQLAEANAGSYYAARIEAEGLDPDLNVTVYLRVRPGGADVVGVERGWPGKVLADPRRDEDPGVSRYASLTPEQQILYEPYALRDADARERDRDTGICHTLEGVVVGRMEVIESFISALASS